MNRGLRRLSLLLIAVGIGLHAQAQAPEPAAQITGRVVRADTGAPIEGAIIQLIPPFISGTLNFQTAKTDSNGEYSFRSVRDGTYEIAASAPGFADPPEYRRDESLESVFQKIDPFTRLRGVDFRLTPEAVIRGMVTEAGGSPVAQGVSVTAVRREKREDGSERLLAISQGLTDATGHFTLKGLPPDSYFLAVNGPQGFNAHPSAGVWYQETWYGNKPSVDGALQVPLKAGEEKDGIEITVKRESRYKVTVWPSGPQGDATPDRYSIGLQNRNHTTMSQRDGSYIIPDVPPGHYTLVSTAWFRGTTYIGQGETDFDVVDADVTVHVDVHGLGEIEGIVTWKGTSGTASQDVVVGITSVEDAAQGHAAVDGRFSILRVLPGRYTFRILKAPPGTVLQTARCNGAEVTSSTPLQMGDKQKVSDCEVVLASQ